VPGLTLGLGYGTRVGGVRVWIKNIFSAIFTTQMTISAETETPETRNARNATLISRHSARPESSMFYGFQENVKT
jgi:hypothetical protein